LRKRGNQGYVCPIYNIRQGFPSQSAGLDGCRLAVLKCNCVTFQGRVSVQGVKSLGGHFACLCRRFEFYELKKKKIVIIFQKENGNTFTHLIISIVKSLQKEQNSTNLLLWPPICRNKSAITPKWFNSLDTNSISRSCAC
jgi:hypothetical protein